MKEKRERGKKEVYINPWVNYTPKRAKRPFGYHLK